MPAPRQPRITHEQACILLLGLIRDFQPEGDTAKALRQHGLPAREYPGRVVLDALDADCLDSYSVASERSRAELHRPLSLALSRDDVRNWPETRSLFEVLGSWMNQFGLTSPWCERVSLEALDLWQRNANIRALQLWPLPSGELYRVRDLNISEAGWNPESGESRADAKERLEKRLHTALRQHLDAVEADTARPAAGSSSTIP